VVEYACNSTLSEQRNLDSSIRNLWICFVSVLFSFCVHNSCFVVAHVLLPHTLDITSVKKVSALGQDAFQSFSSSLRGYNTQRVPRSRQCMISQETLILQSIYSNLQPYLRISVNPNLKAVVTEKYKILRVETAGRAES
jgi:hypothetical protein